MISKAAAITLVISAIVCISGGVAIAVISNNTPTYQITYDLDGGTLASDSPTSYKEGSTVELKDPIKIVDGVGYTFNGWYLDTYYKEPIEKITSDMKGDITLYASWGKKIYSITYYTNGGKLANGSPTSYTEGVGAELKTPTKSVGGAELTFLGWYLDSDLTQKIESITSDMKGNLSLYASWASVGYNINYVLNGGTADPASPTQYQYGTITDLGCPTKTDNIFFGWYLDAECTQNILYINDDAIGDLTVYALWDDSVVTHGFRFSTVETTTERGFWISTYTKTGTYDYTYLAQDDSKGDLLHKVINTKDQYGRKTSSDVTEWSSSDDDYDVTTEEGVIIDINGWKPVTTKITLTSKVNTGYVEEQYYIYDWLPVKINSTYTSTSRTYVGEFIVSDILKEVMKDSYTVTVFEEDGIIVTGSGTIATGYDAVLTASEVPGYSFKGWYDDAGTCLSTELTYTVDTVLSDIVLYAYNTSKYDISVDLNIPLLVDADPSATDITWTLTDESFNVLSSSNESTFSYIFTKAGRYNLIYTAKESGEIVDNFSVIIADEIVQRTFTWEYNDVEYTKTLDISYSDFWNYRSDEINRSQGTADHDREFITYNDPYVIEMADYIKSATTGLTDMERVNVLLRLTQTIPYQYDSEGMGQSEYWKYPLETLYDNAGDCEDTSILFCAIGKAMGYNTALMIFSGHATGAIDLTQVGYTMDNVKEMTKSSFLSTKTYHILSIDDEFVAYVYKETDTASTPSYYLYCETTVIEDGTGKEYKVGVIPSNTYASYNVLKVIKVI